MLDYKKILKYFLFLVVLGVIAGGLLAVVNSVTSPIIQEMNESKLQAELKNIFGQDQKFPTLDTPAGSSKNIVSIYKWNDSNNEQKGVVYKVTTSGYGGDVTILVAFSIDDDKVMGFKVLDVSKETPGFGQNATSFDFKVYGQSVNSVTVDTMTGASITSAAIRKGVQEAAQNYITYKSSFIGGPIND